MKADVSVVIPCYRAENTICRALESITRQRLGVKEVIVVNDGGDFAALATVVDSARSQLDIALVDLGGNFGVAYARNVGVRRSSGRFIAFLDADDIWHDAKVSMQYEFMCRTDAFLSCHGYVPNLNRAEMANSSGSGYRQLRIGDFLLGNAIFTPTVMVARNEFVEFDPSLSRSEDLKCWISNMVNGAFFRLAVDLAAGFKEPLGESGLSASSSLMHQEYLRAWKKLYSEKRVVFRHYFCAVTVERLKYPLRLLRQIFTAPRKI